MTITRRVHRAAGSETLFSVKLRVLTSFALSATNYWTFTLYVRRAASGAFAAQSSGQKLAATYSLATRTLTAEVPVVLYELASGLSMNAGDTVVAVMTTTGSPAALDDARFLVDRVRRTE